jgi:hypothetical protein
MHSNRHSVSHSASCPLPPTTVRQTTVVPHAATFAELTADIKAPKSARMDERIASLEADYKLAITSLATANAMGPYGLAPRFKGISQAVHTTNILPTHDTHTLPPHTSKTYLHRPQILYVNRPQILYVNRPQILYVNRPQILYVNRPQILYLRRSQKLYLNNPQIFYLNMTHVHFLRT